MLINDAQILEMANQLTCLIARQMAGIELTAQSECTEFPSRMDAVYSWIDGQRDFRMQLEANPEFFCRVARNMIGDEPENEVEVREYAEEFFNVLVGRFLSEICKLTKTKARFEPIIYERNYENDWKAQRHVRTIWFLSDKNEPVGLSWNYKLTEK